VFKEVLENHYRTAPVTPTEGCLELFTFLRENEVKIALTTGFYRQVADIILERLGWLDGLDERRMRTTRSPIDLSIAGDEVPQGRPEPFMIQRAMEWLNVSDLQRVINIGDTPSDLQSGHAAGVGLNLGITNGTHRRDQLENYPHHQLVGSLHELHELLGRFALVGH
jgi:phosphonatase-like hydrolase